MIHLKEPKKQTPEGSLLKVVKQYLQLKGYYVVRIQQSFFCHKGVSDLIFLRQGKVYFCECKAPKGQQSQHQIEFQREIEAHGGTYLLVRKLEDLIYAQI